MAYYAPFYQQPTNYVPNNQNTFVGQNNGLYGYSSQQATVPQQNDGMIWVLGRNEAESYPVAPNCQVVLWDKNAQTLYVKSMSANGIPNLRTLDFTERTETQKNTSKNDFNIEVDKLATKDDFVALKSEFERLTERCDRLERLQYEKQSKATENSSKTDKKSKGGNE